MLVINLMIPIRDMECHRQVHVDEHLTKVGEDHHQNEGVRRQVLLLEPVELR
jgi:hypothetical protein